MTAKRLILITHKISNVNRFFEKIYENISKLLKTKKCFQIL